MADEGARPIDVFMTSQLQPYAQHMLPLAAPELVVRRVSQTKVERAFFCLRYLCGCVLLFALSGCTQFDRLFETEDLFVTIDWAGVNFQIPMSVALVSETRKEALEHWIAENKWRGPNVRAVLISNDECRRITSLLSGQDYTSLRSARKPHVSDSQCVMSVEKQGEVVYYYLGKDRQIVFRRLSQIQRELNQVGAEAMGGLINQLQGEQPIQQR